MNYMLLKPSIVPFENENERLAKEFGFEYKDSSNLYNKLVDVNPAGLPMTSDSICEGVKLISNFAAETQKKGFVYHFYHIIICCLNDEKEIIERVKIENVNIKTYIVLLENDLNEEHKITIKSEDYMKIIIIRISHNDIFKLKEFIKLPEIEKKAVVFNIEASSFIGEKQWMMICDFIQDCTNKLKMFDIVSSLIFNDKILQITNNKVIKEDNKNKQIEQVTKYLYE